MKVLEVCAKLNIGGAQKVAANLSAYAGPGLSFTYLVYGPEIGEYEQAIVQRGDRVIHLEEPRSNPLRHIADLISVMRAERPDVVHCHTMFSCGLVMLVAKLCGVPGRISHSHTIQESVDEKQRGLYKTAMRFLITHCGTDFWACGATAGCILYGEPWFQQHGVIIPNGIDLSSYAYSESCREEIRRELGVEDRLVIGHVGHYTPEKNQTYLIDRMPEVLKKRPDAVLLLYGEGVCRDRLEKQVQALRLEDRVRLMGNSGRICQVLSALDVFAFPSLFEGTPLALIEAQANGLPCIISDGIPADACLTSSIERIPLEGAEEQWIDRLCTAERNPHAQEQLRECYEDVTKSMQKMYTEFQKYEK